MRRRFIEAVLIDILGLHNKPKAAVHLVHKLTDPKKKKKKKKKNMRPPVMRIVSKIIFFENKDVRVNSVLHFDKRAQNFDPRTSP
jgi:hypothetical protein